MKFVTAKDVREAETRAIAKDIVLSMVMMDQAGKGLAQTIRNLAAHFNQPNSV